MQSVLEKGCPQGRRGKVCLESEQSNPDGREQEELRERTVRMTAGILTFLREDGDMAAFRRLQGGNLRPIALPIRRTALRGMLASLLGQRDPFGKARTIGQKSKLRKGV